jgi:hypothetical protein
MGERPTVREYYAMYYAGSLPEPCLGCSPLYRAGHERLIEHIREENWGEAYNLGTELYEMCGRRLLQ